MLDTFASHVLMIRPVAFGSNPETLATNRFQQEEPGTDPKLVNQEAVEEFDRLVRVLEDAGILVTVVDALADPHSPDAVFPNNWFSCHQNGAIITYPMLSPLRRNERREDLIEDLMKRFGYSRRYSLEQYEEKNLFLEGTGSMVLDRANRIVFACLSERTDPTLLDKFCTLMGYRRCIFNASDKDGIPIYHTNVMMAMGHTFAIICLEAIKSQEEREMVERTLTNLGKVIVDITLEQMSSFAGNMILLVNREGLAHLVMSSQARASLSPTQVDTLSEHVSILSSSIPTIECYGGGSVRCMMAELVQVTIGSE